MKGSSGGGVKSSKGRGRGRGGGGAPYARDDDWDAMQRRSLADAAEAPDLTRRRPQRPVEAFQGLTVAADWPERRAPRSGSAFYLPLIWTALLLDELDAPKACASAARRQLEGLGDTRHFHDGRARRSTLQDLREAQAFWAQIFSAWNDWARRLRAAMDGFEGGLEGVVRAFVQRTSVTACATVYGNLTALGALPHISNARNTPHQDAILELDFAVRCELEASVLTLFLPGGEAFKPEPSSEATFAGASSTSAGGAAALPQMSSVVLNAADAMADADDSAKEVQKLRKKLREIEKLKSRPIEELDVLQRKKLDSEADIVAKLRELGSEA